MSRQCLQNVQSTSQSSGKINFRSERPVRKATTPPQFTIPKQEEKHTTIIPGLVFMGDLTSSTTIAVVKSIATKLSCCPDAHATVPSTEHVKHCSCFRESCLDRNNVAKHAQQIHHISLGALETDLSQTSKFNRTHTSSMGSHHKSSASTKFLLLEAACVHKWLRHWRLSDSLLKKNPRGWSVLIPHQGDSRDVIFCMIRLYPRTAQ